MSKIEMPLNKRDSRKWKNQITKKKFTGSSSATFLISISKGNTAGGKLLKLKDSIEKEENETFI